METKSNTTSRLATLDELLKTTIPVFLSPVPCRESLRSWFDEAKVPRFKSNPTAKRGGGRVFYSVSAVEKFLRTRTIPGKMASA